MEGGVVMSIGGLQAAGSSTAATYGVKNLNYGQGYGNDRNQFYAENKDVQKNGQFSMGHSANTAVDKNADMTKPAEQTEKTSGNKKIGDYECQTCKNRKYQDGSDDAGVSYQTPTKISPEKAATAVAAHENEHVVRNQAKAEREGKEIVAQSVSLHTAICPECGRTYISGGTTRTVTRNADNGMNAGAENAARDFVAKENGIGNGLDVTA